MSKTYDLIVVTGEPFPYGMAASNRLLCYVSSIATTKKVLVLTYDAPYRKGVQEGGNINGVDYRYMQHYKKAPNKMVRLFFLLYRYVKLLLLLLFSYKCKAVVFLSRRMLYAMMIKCALIIKGVPFYREISETPENIKSRWKREFVLRTHHVFDGFIVISNGIEDLLKKYVRKSRYFFLPVLVQIDRFNNYGMVSKRNIVFYCSGGNAERDGLLDTLNGFIQYRERYNVDIKLEIATALYESDSYHKKVKEVIDGYPLYFTYLGCLPTTEIPKRLMEARALMLTPHKNYVTRGFPTKLGEYLASGTPVICSSIQDLSEQIPSDIVYFVEPNSPTDICEALKHLLSDKQVSTELGERARQWVTANYTMDNYRDSLIQFLSL